MSAELHPNSEGQLGVIGAVAKAIVELEAVGKDAMAQFAKTGGKKPYRSADAVWSALNRVLGPNGLVVVPHHSTVGGGHVVVFVLAHADGSWLRSSVEIRTGDAYKAQETGAALSYASKYFLSQVFAIPFHDDDTEADNVTSADHEGNPFHPEGRRPQSDQGAPKGQKAATTVLPPSQGRVAGLLGRVKALPADYRDKFKAESVALETGSWSFLDDHTWTAAEYEQANLVVSRLGVAARAQSSVDVEVAAAREGTSQPDQTELSILTAKVTAKRAQVHASWDDLLVAYNNHVDELAVTAMATGGPVPTLPFVDDEEHALGSVQILTVVGRLLDVMIDDLVDDTAPL